MKSPEAPMDDPRLARALASLEDHGEAPELPEAAILWRRARLLEVLEARRNAARPVRVAHSIALTLAAGVLLAFAGSKGISLLGWMARSSTGLLLPLTLCLFLLGAGLFLAAGSAAGRNIEHRSEWSRLRL